MLDTNDLPSLLPAVKEIARRAGEQILRIYGTNFTARQKDDGSPLTEADTASEEVIVAALQQLTGHARLSVTGSHSGNAPPPEVRPCSTRRICRHCCRQ